MRALDEIARDPALRVYGAVLACLHVQNFVVWSSVQPLEDFIARGARVLCWPFLEGCHAWRVLDADGVQLLLWGYLALAIAALALFALARDVRAAAAALALASGLHVGIVLQDFALTLNHHYMLAFVALAYLALPHRRRVLPCLLVAFYFWAGTLKLHGEWLSGAILADYPGFWVPPALLPAAAAYAVALELVVVFGLLARRAWIFWGAFAQVLFFHAVSWSVVGFYYPLHMLGLLAILPLLRWLPAPGGDASLGSLLRGREPVASYALLAVFSLLQLVPRAFPGDASLTGEGRLFALDMFDARVTCRGTLVLHDRSGGSRLEEVSQRGIERRIRCDPIVHWGTARQRCREARSDPDFRDLDLHLTAWRSFHREPRTLIALEDFCQRDPGYDLWRHNDWILVGDPRGGATAAR